MESSLKAYGFAIIELSATYLSWLNATAKMAPTNSSFTTLRPARMEGLSIEVGSLSLPLCLIFHFASRGASSPLRMQKTYSTKAPTRYRLTPLLWRNRS